MSVNLRQSQAIAQIAEVLHTFLPGKPPPYTDQSLSFPGIAARVGVAGFWSGGSKKSATIRLLESTLDQHPSRFCRLITEVVRSRLRYRSTKMPISREEIEQLNSKILAVGFKIPELWDPEFLENFPRTTTSAEHPKEPKTPTAEDLRPLRPAFDALHALDARARGFAFERFLRALFDASGLRGRSSFRLVGEQIDGSFSMGDATYLIEAKWENKPLDITPLFAFRSQVAKADWSRDLFISYSGFSDDACAAFSRTGKLNSIGMTGQDLHFILEGKMGLIGAIRAKLMRAAEGDGFLISVQELMLKL